MFAYIKELLAGVNIPHFSIPSFGLTDAIDILSVACLLYLVLRWIRQTRTWSLFKGVVMFLGIAAYAYFFDLVTVKWIVENTFAMGLIVVVLLFQPELRKALEQIGRGRIFTPLSKTRGDKEPLISNHTGSEVIKAVKAMSAVRTGALIVFEQGASLYEYECTGITVDAWVTSQLLINIFEKNTPLHDGAAIIRNNRITAATCILPLTVEEIGRDLGTRHRAAVGMSENTDALVLVVSEETGNISIAVGGRLVRNLNENQLRDMLVKGEDSEDRRFVLFKNRKDKA